MRASFGLEKAWVQEDARMAWWTRFRRVDGSKAANDSVLHEAEWAVRVDGVARQHLEEDIANRWLGLTRPAIHFTTAGEGDHPLVRLRGRPLAPADFSWPEWEGHGPLSYIAGLDLQAVAGAGLEHGLPLPDTGWLHFFYFDGSYDNFDSVVGSWDPASLAGTRVIHVPGDAAPVAEAAPPDGVLEFGQRNLAGQQVVTFPGWEHPVLRKEFQPPGADHCRWMSHPVNSDAFTEALSDLYPDGPRHQLGGWADPVQGPVELEAAEAAGGAPVSESTTADNDAALRWNLLLQIDTDDDAEMMWGDCGMLYWMTDAGEAEPITAEHTSFTWQCG